MENLDVACTAVVQTVFQRNVVDKRLVLLLYIVSGRYFSSDDNLEAVVPESFGKLEVIIRTGISGFALIGRSSISPTATCCSTAVIR